MNKNIRVAVLIAAFTTASWSAASIAQVASKPDHDPARELSRAELDDLLSHPESVLLVDVRRPDELLSIGGFGVYLSIQPADVEKSLALIPRERTIVTVSNHATRAIRVAKALAAYGFKVAGVVGAQDYEEQGGTLTKVAPRVPAQAAASAGAK